MSGAQGPSRRRLLAGLGGAAVAAALAGCTSEPAAPLPLDPDGVLRDTAVAREQSLLRAYDVVLLAEPTLTALLLRLRGEHVEHLTALTGPLRATSQPTASAPTASASAVRPPAVPAVPPPPTTAVMLSTLAAAERDAAASHEQGALASAGRPLAALLASLSASEQSHPVALA